MQTPDVHVAKVLVMVDAMGVVPITVMGGVKDVKDAEEIVAEDARVAAGVARDAMDAMDAVQDVMADVW